jgi:hypothetical protein
MFGDSMKSRTLRFTTLLLVVAGAAAAQQSPPAQASITVGGKTISIRYSAPSVRGRKIFGDGGLLSQDPTYPAWRAGANAATLLHTDADLEIATLRIPKGDYTLYCWVKDPESWDLIVNRQTGQTGLEYNASLDLGRVKMNMSRPPKLVEQLKYTLTDQGGGKVKLELANHAASVIATAK